MADYANPLNTKLDANQVLIRSYDEVENALRVNAKVTATIGSVDVIIDAASGDNIAISDGVDTLSVNSDGSINVIVQDITLSKDNDSIEIFQANHDNVNVNANIQVNNTDASLANPVPVTDENNDVLLSTRATEVTQLDLLNSQAIDKTYTRIEVATKNDDGSPTSILIKNGLTTVRTLTLIYDTDGDFLSLEKS